MGDGWGRGVTRAAGCMFGALGLSPWVWFRGVVGCVAFGLLGRTYRGHCATRPLYNCMMCAQMLCALIYPWFDPGLLGW